jgi:DNA sulfur modification protein DndB
VNDTKLQEVEASIERKRRVGMAVTNYATLPGIKGNQFGREIFSSMIRFEELDEFLRTFPDVQRDITPYKVAKIKTYILDGLQNKEALRFFSAITCTCRGDVFYDEANGRLAIDTRASKLSINDGQHRFTSIQQLVIELEDLIPKARTLERRTELMNMLEYLKGMTIPLVIFNKISEMEEKQLFHDINNLAQRPSRSSTIRLAQTDLIATMTRDLVKKNTFMIKYGIEMEKSSVHINNPNLLLLTTIYLSAKELLKVNPNGEMYGVTLLDYKNYQDRLEMVNETFNEIFRALPHDITDKEKYILAKHFALKGIVRFIRQARNQSFIEPLIYEAIKRVDWTQNLDYWKTYGAFKKKDKPTLYFPHGEASVDTVKDACFDQLRAVINRDEYPF